MGSDKGYRVKKFSDAGGCALRIIDKNTDFYDYLQDSSDTLVFDRRGSYLLTKEDISKHLWWYSHRPEKYKFLLLQCGATFWLILVIIKESSQNSIVTDCTMEALTSWVNFDKPNALLKLDVPQLYKSHKMYDSKIHDYSYDKIKANVDDLVDQINRNDFRIECNISKFNANSDYRQDPKRVPLLKATGLGNFIDSQQMFCAIEEYFSIEKTKLETTEAKGTTNDIKIESHGFDLTTSFRGKASSRKHERIKR